MTSPGSTAGNRGSVAAIDSCAVSAVSDEAAGLAATEPASRPSTRTSTVATWAPARGDDIVATLAAHGPEPLGRLVWGGAANELAVSSRTAIAMAPRAAGAAVRRSRRRNGDCPEAMPADPIASAVANRTSVSGRTPGPARLAATAPTASHALAVIRP